MTEDDFRPTASWENLRTRAELLRRVRAFFEARDYLEVETPYLSADTVVDRHLDPLESRYVPDPTRPATGRGLYLQTSPELGMKRLLAAGGTALWQAARVFRNGEAGRRHNPEFTMVEWYRVGDDHHAQMTVTSDLIGLLLGLPPAERLTYRTACERAFGLDPHVASPAELLAACRTRNLTPPPGDYADDRDGLLDFLVSELVQPRLGIDRPAIVYDYPESQSALARTRREPAGYAVAERFEMYVNGLELANGYHELLDPDELLCRNRRQNSQRVRDGKSPLPETSRLIAAMHAGLPPCAGVALGFDRVVMLAVGTHDIRDVLAIPFDRA